MTPAQQTDVEKSVVESPARSVGRGALTNLSGILPSLKNDTPRLFESHTVECTFLYELELDPTVLAYYVQVPCTGVVHRGPTGKRYISAACIDVLVFRSDCITLVECKSLDWLLKREGKKGWTRESGRWTRVPYEEWATHRGIRFEVWTPPFPLATYLRNIQAVYACIHDPLCAANMSTIEAAVRVLDGGPASIAALSASIAGFDATTALLMIGSHRAYGLIKSYSILDATNFVLYSSRALAEAADEAIFGARAQGLRQPSDVANPLLRCTNTDFQAATKRLSRLQSVAAGRAPPTRRMTQLAKRVAKAVSEGKPALVACLTHYERSGNRIARLNEQQTHALTKIAERWQSPDAPQTKCDAWFELEDLCKAEGIDTPSSTTLSRHLRMQDGARRALNNGGLRAYQALAPRSDPTFRSGRAVGYGHTLHIDSSKRDVRCGSELEALQKERRSKKSKEWTTDIFYVGVDDATELPMAHAFVVGPARVDAEAILLREYVFRHKMLPREIIVDRGPENRSIWLQEFCLLHGIKLTYAMTAGSRANSQAEFVIGQVNAQVAHKLAGSTAPDKAGRAVDGRFKSRATARHAFLTVCELFKEFLYEFLPSIPKENGTTPLQCKEELLAKLSPMGTPQVLDDGMLFATSRRWDRYTTSEKRGIRLGSHFYTSDAVRMHLRGSMPDEIRPDSVDPSTLWVKFGSDLTKAFHSSVTLMASLSTEERLWNHLIDKVVQRDNREDKRNQARKLHQSLQRAASAAPATQHLAPSSPQCEQQEDRKDSEQSSEWEKAWDQATPLA